MPKLLHKVPKFCRHARGQAFVKIDGRQVWLGRHDDPKTREAYDRLVAGWLANGRRLPEQPSTPAGTIVPGTSGAAALPLTIHGVLAPYWRWAKQRYTPAEVDTLHAALKVLERLFGSTDALGFGPNALRTVRAEMVRIGWTRKQINRQVSRVRGLFRWAAAHEMLPERIYNQLRCVEPLRRGEAPERPKVRPVPRKLIRAVRRRVARPVRALIDLQLLTAARADELLDLTPAQLDRSREVWVHNPDEHKTAHHDRDRRIYFGPRAQRVLRLFMRPGVPGDRPLFSPRDAERERHARAAVHRRERQAPNSRKTDRTLGVAYTTGSYRRAIHRALAQAFPVPKGSDAATAKRWRREHTWGPHRLRHNAATFLRREFGIEVARSILGHSSSITTLIYAEADERRAMRAIAKVG